MGNTVIDLKNFNYNNFQKEPTESLKAGQPLTGKDGIVNVASSDFGL